MNDHNLKIGDIVWEMRGRRQNGITKWAAQPRCIEYADEHKFLFADGCGASWNSIGKNYFLSRQDAMDDFLKRHDSLATKSAEPDAPVYEAPRTDWEDYEIYPGSELENITKIFLNDNPLNTSRLIWQTLPDDDWRKSDAGCEYSMTLNQLSTQLYAMGERGIITVVVEGPMHGDIFQIGNYSEMKWGLHGTTRGYA